MGWREKNRPDDPGRSRFLGWHGHRRGGWRFYRRMRTTQERRAWDAEFGRAKRAAHRLPEAWDDRPRQVERSWKRHRRTRYRRVAAL